MFKLTFNHAFSECEGAYTTIAGAIDAGKNVGWSFRVTCHGVVMATWDPIGGLSNKGTVALYAEREACDDVPLGIFDSLEDAYFWCVKEDEHEGDNWLEGYNIVAQQVNGDSYLLEMDAWSPVKL